MSETRDDFDATQLDASELGEHVSAERLFRDYVRGIYVMFKASFLYETNNATLRQACERVSKMANLIRERLESIARLELLPDGAYVNRTLVRLDFSSYDQADYVQALCSALGVHAILVTGPTTLADWIDLVAELQRCTGPGGNLESFTRRKYNNIQLDTTPNVRGGTSASDRYRAIQAYATLVIMLGELVDDARLGKPLRPARIKRPLQELVSLSRDCTPLLLALAHIKRHELAELHHLANTAVFVICGIKPLKLSRVIVCELALRAALHDIGRAVAPPAANLTGMAADRRIAEQSVRTLATGALGTRLMARAVVANEVRRWVDRDSEGSRDDPYPFSLGTATKLVAVARAYSMLLAPTAAHPAGILPDEALRVLTREAGRRYDTTAVKLVVNALGVYPVGSVVLLSDGRTAIVVEAPREEAGPLRPRVKIVRETGGETVDGALVDLGAIDGTHLQIMRCIDAEAQAVNAPAFLLS